MPPPLSNGGGGGNNPFFLYYFTCLRQDIFYQLWQQIRINMLPLIMPTHNFVS